jgi:hypothetical protein
MSKLIVCSVGTSLLRNYCDPKLRVEHEGVVDEFDNPLYDREAVVLTNRIARAGSARWPIEDQATLIDVRDRLLEKLTKLVHNDDWCGPNARLRPERRRWSRTVGAELATIAYLRPLKANGDRIVLVCSETAESVFCAQQIWEACRAWGWSATQTVEDDIHLLKGLIPSSPTEFETAICVDLSGLLATWTSKQKDTDELIFVGSGGYKAAAALYYVVVAGQARPASRSLVFLHEEGDECIGFVVIPAHALDPAIVPLGTDIGRHVVFVCYNSRDRIAVDELCRSLSEHGIRLWMAPSHMLPGSYWPLKLGEVIDAVEIAIVCLGDTISDWQRKEIAMLERDANEKLVIPVILPTTQGKPEIPAILSIRHTVDLRESTASIQQVVAALRGKPAETS